VLDRGVEVAKVWRAKARGVRGDVEKFMLEKDVLPEVTSGTDAVGC